MRLQQQPFDVLRTLITRPGEVVTRDDLRKALWADGVTVDFDQSLNKSVTKLRDALGDLATSPRFIETLPKRGYRFIADVYDADAAHPTVRTVPEQAARPVTDRLGWPPVGVVVCGGRSNRSGRHDCHVVHHGHAQFRAIDRGTRRDVPQRGQRPNTRADLCRSRRLRPRSSCLVAAFRGKPEAGSPALYAGGCVESALRRRTCRAGRQLGASGQLWLRRSPRGHAACARRGESRAAARPQPRPRPCLARANGDDLRLGLAHRRLAFRARDRARARRRDDPPMVCLLLQCDRSPSGGDRRGAPGDRGRPALAVGEYGAGLRAVPVAAL